MYRDFRSQNLTEWKLVLKELFPVAIPNSSNWTNLDSMITVLNCLGRENLNHTFLPDHGGMDLVSAELASETDCLLLNVQGFYLVKPLLLSFHSFGTDYEWAYFRLETAGLRSSGQTSAKTNVKEVVSEIEPGKYLDFNAVENWEYFDEDGNPESLPQSARHITRYFGGTFVIFAKSSPYNEEQSTYDSRHNKMSDKEFEQYIGLARLNPTTLRRLPKDTGFPL